MKNPIVLSHLIFIVFACFTFNSCKSNKINDNNVTSEQYEVYEKNFYKLNFILDSIESVKYPISPQKILVDNGAVIYPYFVLMLDFRPKLTLLVKVKNSWEFINTRENLINLRFDSSENNPYIKLKFNYREEIKDFEYIKQSDISENQENVKNLLENSTIFNYEETKITIFSKFGKDLEKYYPPVNITKD
jgi:hypothetical protein